MTHRTISVFCITLCVLGSAILSAGAVSFDYFLSRPAFTIDQVLRQTQTNPVVCGRFARYFHLAPSRVRSYLRSALTTQKHLTESREYTVFYARANGLIYPAQQTLVKGTSVFIGHDGLPLLLVGSGNPIVKYAITVNTVVEHPTQLRTPSHQEILIPADKPDTIIPTTEPTPVYQTPEEKR